MLRAIAARPQLADDEGLRNSRTAVTISTRVWAGMCVHLQKKIAAKSLPDRDEHTARRKKLVTKSW
jgi:hypothetical protein